MSSASSAPPSRQTTSPCSACAGTGPLRARRFPSTHVDLDAPVARLVDAVVGLHHRPPLAAACGADVDGGDHLGDQALTPALGALPQKLIVVRVVAAAVAVPD